MLPNVSSVFLPCNSLPNPTLSPSSFLLSWAQVSLPHQRRECWVTQSAYAASWGEWSNPVVTQSQHCLPLDPRAAACRPAPAALQGDVWLFAECKDNHWAINGNQKGTISKVLSCDTCLVCVCSEEENPGEEKKQTWNLNCSMRRDIKFTGLSGLFIWLYDWWAYLSAE